MIVDSSALVSVVLLEDDAEFYARKLSEAPLRRISTVTLAEASMVLLSRAGQSKVDALDTLIRTLNIEVVPFDREQAILAREAFDRYGKGRHKARLNIADCFVYALAKRYGEPLLFKGNDFTGTDLDFA
jgi:ribonuclease VapC